MHQPLQARLDAISAVFLNPQLHYQALWDASRQLRDLYFEACEFDPSTEQNRAHIPTPQGSAIGPTWAAMCIEDIQRTRTFLRGIQAAIEAKLAINSSRPVRALYVGCGPFATLLTPLTSVFSAEEVQIHCLEINAACVDYLGKLVRAFGLENYFVKIEQIDALDFQFETPDQFDLVVCETLLAGLFKEPQVAISLHLCRQMHPATALIPESIRVAVALQGPMQHQGLAPAPPQHLEPTLLFALDKHTLDLATLCVNSTFTLPAAELNKRHDLVVVLTEITVYGAHVLLLNQSGLTIPVKIAQRYGNGNYLARLNCRYELGAKPGPRFEFEYEPIPPITFVDNVG